MHKHKNMEHVGYSGYFEHAYDIGRDDEKSKYQMEWNIFKFLKCSQKVPIYHYEF